MSIEKYRNGKVFVDEIGLHEDEDETIEDDELNEDEILDETTANNETVIVDAPIVTCTSQDSKSK